MRLTNRENDGAKASAGLRWAARRTLAALLTAVSCVAAGMTVATLASRNGAAGGSAPIAFAALGLAIVSGVHAYRLRVEASERYARLE